MSITNLDKPTTSFSNTTKVDDAELWSTITSTWASETRTWLDCVSLMENSSLENVTFLWAQNSSPWQYLLPWQVTAGITNVNKP